MYGMNEAMAASDERTAAKNTRLFLSEANSIHRAKPVFGFACFDFAFVFKGISRGKIDRSARKIIEDFPDNRLMQHIMQNCTLRYGCPAAKNLSLGRYEAPLPTSRTCNARCIGCISQQEEGSKICATPQCRLTFTPTPEEVVEIMRFHAGRETEKWSSLPTTRRWKR